jgi:hypothetical protein
MKGAIKMSLTDRELWATIHGMTLGALFLLAFGGGLAGLYSLRPAWLTTAGIKERVPRLMAGTWVMALVAWVTVITGTYIIYPWYRAVPSKGADLTQYPKSFLVQSPQLAEWHNFGMEWKEHIAWLAPILATAVAYIVVRYGPQLAREPKIRQALITFFTLAFLTAAVAGLLGAFITKAAPIH